MNSRNGYGHDDSTINTQLLACIAVPLNCPCAAVMQPFCQITFDYLLLLLFTGQTIFLMLNLKMLLLFLDFIQHGYSETSPPVKLQLLWDC